MVFSWISVISAKPIRSTALWMASLHCNSLYCIGFDYSVLFWILLSSVYHENRRLSAKKSRLPPNTEKQLSHARMLVDQAVSSTLLAALPTSSFCLKRPLALKPGMEVDSKRLDTFVLGLV